MKILLIAGHGAGDPGACGNGYREADLTREVAKLLNTRFEDVCQAEVADTSRNWFEYLGSHSYNFKGYDYVLEIHFNAGGGVGTEIFVTTSEQGVGVETAIVKQISAATGLRNRGVKRTNFRVISRVKSQGVSAALLETCFIDSASDVNIYQTKKAELINGIVKGIAEGFGLKAPVEAHWAKRYYDTLHSLGDITDPAWQNYDGSLPIAFALALLDKTTGGTWTSEESDPSIHWAHPHIISLCGKGIICDKNEWIKGVTAEETISNALTLALFDKAFGGMEHKYAGRIPDHWGRNHLDSLCDKRIVTTPAVWTDFEAATTYGMFMAMLCKAFGI